MLLSPFVSNFIITVHIVLFLFQFSNVTFLCHVFIVSGGVVLHWIPNRAVRSGFEPWLGSFCCVFGQETLHSQCLSPSIFRFVIFFHLWKSCNNNLSSDYCVTGKSSQHRRTTVRFRMNRGEQRIGISFERANS